MPRSRTATTLAMATGALFAANLVALTAHDPTGQDQRGVEPADGLRPAPEAADSEAAPEPEFTVHPGLSVFPSPVFSSGPAATATLPPEPTLAFDPSTAAVTPTPTLPVPAPLPAGQGVVVPAAAAPSPPSASAAPPAAAASPPASDRAAAPAPSGVLQLPDLPVHPDVSVLPDLPVVAALAVDANLIRIDLTTPVFSASWTSPLDAQPSPTATTAVVSASVFLGLG